MRNGKPTPIDLRTLIVVDSAFPSNAGVRFPRWRRRRYMALRAITTASAPPGWRWVFCRFRRVKNSQRLLDAHEYGYTSWCFLVRA